MHARVSGAANSTRPHARALSLNNQSRNLFFFKKNKEYSKTKIMEGFSTYEIKQINIF